MLDNVTLVQLRTFAAVARERNFSRAAAVLGYTPSAVHQQMGKLETALGLSLLNRDQTPLELTREGLDLLPSVTAVLEGVIDLDQAARSARGHPHLLIGAGQATGVHVVPSLLRDFARVAPDCSVEYRLGTANELLEQVAGGQLDLAISSRLDELMSGKDRAHLKLVPWRKRSGGLYGFYRSTEWHDARTDVPLYVPPYANAASAARMLSTAFDQMDEGDWRVLRMPGADAVRSASLSGLGYGYLPDDSMADAVAAGTVLRQASDGRSGWIYLLYRRARPVSRGLRTMVGFLASQRHEQTPAEPGIPAVSSA